MPPTQIPRAGKKKRSWKHMAKIDRCNLKMWAEGAREGILGPHIPGYTDTLERGYHARISWRLGDKEEPELPLPDYDKFVPQETEELDEEELTMNAVSY
jgi:hypothetical protein